MTVPPSKKRKLEHAASQEPLLCYDYILQLAEPLVARHTGDDDQAQKLRSVLQCGLGDRINSIVILQSRTSWQPSTTGAHSPLQKPLLVGCIVNPATVDRTVDHGPSAEAKSEAAAFRNFWGEKAELRRFKDGSILESLVWDSKDTMSVFEQIVRYLIARTFGQEAEQGATLTGDGFKRLLPKTSKPDAFQPSIEAYTQLETDIRSLQNLPLSIRQIMPCDAQLRCASIDLPGGAKHSVPADVTIQFEGSTRWPDDIVAVQRTKMAFLLNISEKLHESVDAVHARIGLENEEYDVFNQAFLDITYDQGATFRLRIHHEREQALLERRLKDKTLDPRSKELAAQALAKYKRNYIKGPAFTQAIARLCSRHPVLSGVMRLTKKWFASHLLSNHIAEEVIEMLVARTFVHPHPWATPSSVQTGFLRTLWWISRWNWRNEPLIVDLSLGSDLKKGDTPSIQTKFEAWRSLDPALNRVVLFCASNVDLDGVAWTDGRTPKVVAARMNSLAKAACVEVEERGLRLEPASLFTSGLDDFDFIVHLNSDLVSGKPRRARAKTNGASFKNLEIDVGGDMTRVGYQPALEFREELEDIYGSSVLLFSGGDERPIIAGLWNPQTASRPWKLNLAYSTTVELDSEQDEILASLNKNAILAEMARLGGDIVDRIEINRS